MWNRQLQGIAAAVMIALSADNTASAASPTLQVTSATTTFRSGVIGELEKVVASHRGVMGIAVKNLRTGEELAVNASEEFPTASTIKTPVMCAALELLANGTGPYKSYYDTKTYDASTSTGGSGFIRNHKHGTKLELKELIHLMITVSDNIATNMIVEWIGIDTVNNWLEKNGYQSTRLFSTVGGSQVYDQEGRQEWGLGRTTPLEMCRLMEQIATGKAGTTSTTDEMLRVLGNQYFDDLIGGEIPPTIYVGSKSGAVNRSRSDNAIVASPGATYIISVYTKDNQDARWTSANEAEQKIRDVSRIVFRHFNPDSTWQRPPQSDAF
jgi:beta-lactamase class A